MDDIVQNQIKQIKIDCEIKCQVLPKEQDFESQNDVEILDSNKPSNKRRPEKSDLPATAEMKMNKNDDLIGTSKINNFTIIRLKYSPSGRLTIPSI